MSFTAVNFILLFSVLAVGYSNLAQAKYDKKQELLAKNPNNLKGQIELAGYPKDEIPSVWMDIKPDMKDGYNIHFITTNFKFAPEKVSTMHVMGEGTINLYVNGERIARVYDEWYHVNLEPGVNEIMVTLNSNELTEYTIRGKPISSSESITVD